MKIVKPSKLNKGDVIGLISPASTPDDLTRIEKSVKYFESLGYKVKTGKKAFCRGRDVLTMAGYEC